MRYIILAVLCAILMPGRSLAALSPEAAKISGNDLFQMRTAASLMETSWPTESLLEDPRLQPRDFTGIAGPKVGQVKLADLLDRHRNLVTRPLGGQPWDISLAGDSTFDKKFFTFAQPDKLVIAPMGDPREGVDVTIAPGVVYNFRIVIEYFNPIRGSTLHIKPVQGTQGASHEIKTGVLLDAIKSKSYVFRANNKEYWLLHGTDVDPATNTLATTKSLLFFHLNGTSSKGWPIAESSLKDGQGVAVNLGGTNLVLLRTPEGELLIHTQR